jgi:hypothetical protein
VSNSFEAASVGARASWSAEDLCRFSNTARHSKGRWQTVAAFCVFLALSPQAALHAQPAATNRVLDLDGKGGYVELPPNIFNDLKEATVEAWVKWRSFPTNEWARFFSYGERYHDTGIEGSADGGLHFFLSEGKGAP